MHSPIITPAQMRAAEEAAFARGITAEALMEEAERHPTHRRSHSSSRKKSSSSKKKKSSTGTSKKKKKKADSDE